MSGSQRSVTVTPRGPFGTMYGPLICMGWSPRLHGMQGVKGWIARLADRSLVAEDRSAADVRDRTGPEPQCSRDRSELARQVGLRDGCLGDPNWRGLVSGHRSYY